VLDAPGAPAPAASTFLSHAPDAQMRGPLQMARPVRAFRRLHSAPLEADLDSLAAATSVDPGALALFLLDAAPARFLPLDGLAHTLHALADCDVWAATPWRVGGGGGGAGGAGADAMDAEAVGATFPDSAVRSVAARAVAVFNTHPAAGAFRPITRPAARTAADAAAINRALLRSSALGCGLDLASNQPYVDAQALLWATDSAHAQAPLHPSLHLVAPLVLDRIPALGAILRALQDDPALAHPARLLSPRAAALVRAVARHAWEDGFRPADAHANTWAAVAQRRAGIDVTAPPPLPPDLADLLALLHAEQGAHEHDATAFDPIEE
jgi:hypothetical protein